VSDGQRVLFYSGDEADAKADVRKTIERSGYPGVDPGVLMSAVHGPPCFACVINFIKI